MALFDPAHPGALIHETLEGIFEETGKKLTVAEVAAGLGTTRKTLSTINGKRSVTPEMAIRLGTDFASTPPEFWLTVQENYDLAQARPKVDTSNVRVFWKPINFLGQNL